MKTIKLFLVAIIIASVFSSCRKKDNDAADQLEGDWQIVTIIKGNGVVDPNSMPQSVTLTACNVKKDECIGKWVSNKGDQNDFFWTITEKGTIFTITVDPAQPANQATSDLADYKGDYDIQELSETAFIVKKESVTIEFSK